MSEDRPQFRDETCAACGHEQRDHCLRVDHCHACPSKNRCQQFVDMGKYLPPIVTQAPPESREPLLLGPKPDDGVIEAERVPPEPKASVPVSDIDVMRFSLLEIALLAIFNGGFWVSAWKAKDSPWWHALCVALIGITAITFGRLLQGWFKRWKRAQ